VARKPPTSPAELQEYLLGPEQGLARALAGRVNPGYHRSSTKYVSSTKRDFDDPNTRKEPVEPVSTQHFHSLDDIGKHGALRCAALRGCRPGADVAGPRSGGDGPLRRAAQGPGAQEVTRGRLPRYVKLFSLTWRRAVARERASPFGNRSD